MLVQHYYLKQVKPKVMTDQKDRHLEAPSEANRDKHINFLAEERGEMDPAAEANTSNINNLNDTPGGGSNDSDKDDFLSLNDRTMQTPEEHERDKNTHPSEGK